MGLIYCITFKNGKRYIGQTTRTIEKRMKEHLTQKGCIALHAAIEKYGEDNYTIEILIIVNDELLDDYEKTFIKLFNTLVPNGYNIRDGGSNGKHCEESRERMRQAKIGPKNHNYGKPRTEETRAKISEKKKGENHHFYNKELSIEHKQKLSEVHKKYDSSLPIYIGFIKERPKYYQGAGYVVIHPKIKKRHFTSNKFSIEEKLELAKNYLNSSLKELEENKK